MRSIALLIGICWFFFASARFIFAANISFSGGQASMTATDVYIVSVSLFVANAARISYYLRGVFYQPGTTHYCGYTWNGSSWVKGPYSENNGWTHFLQVTTQNSSWSGQLKAKFDPTESKCSKSGTYHFKVERFTKRGSGIFDTQAVRTVQVTVLTPTAMPNSVSPSFTPRSTASDGAPTLDEQPSPSQPTAMISQTTSNIKTATTMNHEDSGQSEDAPPEDASISATAFTSERHASTSAKFDETATNSSVLGLQREPTSSTDPQNAFAKSGLSSGIWVFLCMGGVLLMAGCGIVLFQIKRGR